MADKYDNGYNSSDFKRNIKSEQGAGNESHQDGEDGVKLNEKAGEYMRELLAEKIKLTNGKFPVSTKLIDQEVAKVQASGRTPGRDNKYLDVYREKPAKVSVKVLVPLKEHPKTSHINTVNPIVDRLMDDESVEGVVMTNKEGNPVLTSVSVTAATSYASNLHRYGMLAQSLVKELDPFDEMLVIRLKTKKIEIMLTPDPEFNIIVVQHSRHKKKDIIVKKK